ncbi:MAG: hypothetical protein ACRDTI_20820 [Mycobacterium sp.]
MAAPTAVGNIKNVFLANPKGISVIGGLYYGPLDAAIPDATFAIDSRMNHSGFLSDDALDEEEQRNIAKKYAWGSDQVASPQESFGLTLGFTMLEFLNVNVAKLAYGDQNVTATAASATHGNQLSIFHTSDKLGMRSWLLDTYDQGKHVQKFYPMGEIESKKTQKFSNKEILAHTVVATFYPDANGKYGYIRTDDGLLTV